ncbi:hypothetical protein G6011_03120 [Alternaria panax]|uniref:Xylanolytic transcriptional activator regulatory domain-containing protein n=1 Tax=Alternaria panax TaxID=48097 RepID=A0AAD4IEF7_9PLEO|nr:hypothetical protein G6011_03120 [Alternaria panax]
MPIAPIQPREHTASMDARRMPSNASATISGTSSSQSSFSLDSMRARIAELEDQLSRAGSSASSAFSPSASTPVSTHTVHTVSSFACIVDVLQDTRTPGGVAISRGIAHKNRVFGQSHWMNGFVMYRDIIEIMEPYLQLGSSNLVPSMRRAKSLARIIKSRRSPTWPTPPTRNLPPRHVCDDLIACYLRTMETIYRVLHVPSFKHVYEHIWTSGSEPNMAFVVMLKLVLAIGAMIYDDQVSMRVEAVRWVFEAQTWLSSPFFKSQLGVQYVQISILLLLARQLVDVGSELVWISAGAVFRAAVYIGLHKDPSQLPRTTVLEAEVRRRIWNTILELSLQMSMESGGPPFFSSDDYNTAPPSNFDDEQLLDAEPIAKADEVYTHTSISIALRKTLPARLAVLKFLNDINSTGTYEETLRIDAGLRTAHKLLRRTIQAYATSATSSPCLFTLQAVEFIMQRYITCLHLPFFASALNVPLYAYSRKATVDSSLKIWRMACPDSSSVSHPFRETDIARVCRCTAGFFRMYAFHGATFLANELRMRIQEDDDDLTELPLALKSILDDAANWYLGCIQAGETGIKGYLLLRLIGVWIDATNHHRNQSDLPALLVEASEQAAEVCLPILEVLAGSQEPSSSATGMGGISMEDFDFQLSTEFTEDWDMLMSGTFNMNEMGTFDAFLS